MKSASDVLALARSKPGQITYASAGLGSINQIAAELIATSAGVKFTHVPYKGGAPALNDLIGGHVDIYVSSLPQVLQLARDGQARPLAVTSARRTALLPDVPTLDGGGYRRLRPVVLVGHCRSGRHACRRRQGAQLRRSAKCSTSPELAEFLKNEGAEAATMTPEQFGDLMRLETERWIKVAHEANISID